jgi:hypothetical protein
VASLAHGHHDEFCALAHAAVFEYPDQVVADWNSFVAAFEAS